MVLTSEPESIDRQPGGESAGLEQQSDLADDGHHRHDHQRGQTDFVEKGLLKGYGVHLLSPVGVEDGAQITSAI